MKATPKTAFLISAETVKTACAVLLLDVPIKKGGKDKLLRLGSDWTICIISNQSVDMNIFERDHVEKVHGRLLA